MNLSGKWTYKEDFEFGTSEGEAILKQKGANLEATFFFTEQIKNEYKIQVTEMVEGTISGGAVSLQSIDVKAVQDEKEVAYLPNSFDIQKISENQLVGSTYDREGVCGVFVMVKIS